MRVDDEQGNYSPVMHSIKRNYTLNYKKAHGITTTFHLWQYQYMENVAPSGDRRECDPRPTAVSAKPQAWAWQTAQEHKFPSAEYGIGVGGFP